MTEEADQNSSVGRRKFLRSALSMAGVPLLGQSRQPKGNPPLMSIDDHRSAHAMARAAEAFINSLTAEQRARAKFSMEDEQRFDWHFIPRQRKGVAFKELDPTQRLLASALLGSGLGPQGFAKATTIMSLDAVLREMEPGRAAIRDPELYFVSLFGEAQSNRPWGWRVEGHHLSLNFTIVDGGNVASTPAFFGANPAEVQHGPRKGLRVLADEEELALALVKSLDDKQRAVAVVSDKAPSDILSSNVRRADALRPAGLQAGKLGGKQQDILMSLLKEYASRHAPYIAAARLDRIRSSGIGNTFFAWAGGFERGLPHYYRIQGSYFLIEFDNIQNNANHIHSVWRDFDGDFGLDLLALHHQKSHR